MENRTNEPAVLADNDLDLHRSHEEREVDNAEAPWREEAGRVECVTGPTHFGFSSNVPENTGRQRRDCPAQQFLKLCGQHKPLPFTRVIPPSVSETCEKIGEGRFSDVYRIKLGDQGVVLKIVPIRSRMHRSDDMRPIKEHSEIVIAKELTKLRDGVENKTDAFCPLRRAHVVRGPYPEDLLIAWDRYPTRQRRRPDGYRPDQHYIVMEFGFGGRELCNYKVPHALQALSIFEQVACALAVAEEVWFEHRDLHVRNVLVEPTHEATQTSILDSVPIYVFTHGIRVNIIDFTLARIADDDGRAVFTNLGQIDENVPQIFKTAHSLMNNEWKEFHPVTNVVWLLYLCDHLIDQVNPTEADPERKDAYEKLCYFARTLCRHQSASHFVHCSDIYKIRPDRDSRKKSCSSAN